MEGPGEDGRAARAEEEDSSFREDSSFEGLPVVVATRSKKKKKAVLE